MGKCEYLNIVGFLDGGTDCGGKLIYLYFISVATLITFYKSTAYNSYFIQTWLTVFTRHLQCVYGLFKSFKLENQNCMNVPSTRVNMNDIKQSCYVCVHFLNKHWRLFLES